MQTLPLIPLRAFEAAARTGSFRAAAEELCISPSAVSHAVRKLEVQLGTALFERVGRSVQLSPQGENLMRHISLGFDELRRGMELVEGRGNSLLRLHCAPSMAAQWLMPRLSRLRAESPGFEVRLATGTDYTRFLNDEFDADIVYGPPRQEGLIVLPLGEETVTPLCAPALAGRIRTAADLLDQVLIESEHKRVRWDSWFAANDLLAPAPRGSRFDRSFMAIAAAVDGMGVALESTRFAERELQRGQLVQPLLGTANDIRYVAHYLVFPQQARTRRAVSMFVSWMATELSLDFKALF